MKNTLFLDADFHPELLENEEASEQEMRNAVFLRFTTTGSGNQKLQIYVKSALYEIPLTSATEYTYQLVGLYWANDGITSVRIVNDDGTTDYIYITFPEVVQTDAALQPIEGEEHSYYMQGKEDIAQEIRSETISKTNGRDYYVEHLTKIIEFVFASRAGGISGLLTFTVTMTVSGVEDEADAVFRIRVNRTFDEVFIPTHTVKNRKYIITICYPVNDIAATERNQVDIYLDMGGAGTAEILQGHAIATITASSLATTGKFTGEIECLDITEALDVPEAMAMANQADAISISQRLPIGATRSDTVTAVDITSQQISDAMTDQVRIINHGSAEPRALEDSDTIRTTEDGDTRMTEQEAS